MIKSLFVLIFAAIGLTLLACGTQLDSDEPAPAAIDNSVNAVVAPRTNPSAPSENPTTSSVTASIASSADSPTSLDVTSRSSDSLAVPRPIVEQGNEVSDTAFGFTLPNALGSDQTLESFRGDKNVVVVFYRAFWWVHCREQLGELSDHYNEFQDLDTEVLAISTDDLRGAESIAQRVGIAFPILFDPDAEVVKSYGVYNKFRDRLAAPSTFIISKNGVIQWKYVASEPYYDRPSVKQVLEQLRAIEG